MKKNKLFNHLKKTVSSYESRPILQCVHYDKDGSLYATDSHVAIRVHDFHKLPESLDINVFTMEIYEGNYPSMSHNFDVDIKSEISVHIPTLIKSVKPFIDKAALIHVVDISVKGKELTMTSNRLDGYSITIPLADGEGETELSVNPQYLLKGLEFIQDAKASNKNNDYLAVIKFQTAVRPFLIESGNGYEYLVTPVRKY